MEVRQQMSPPPRLRPAACGRQRMFPVFAGGAQRCRPDSAAAGDLVSMAQRDRQGRWDCEAGEEGLGHSSYQCPRELTRTVPRGPRQSKRHTKKVCLGEGVGGGVEAWGEDNMAFQPKSSTSHEMCSERPVIDQDIKQMRRISSLSTRDLLSNQP